MLLILLMATLIAFLTHAKPPKAVYASELIMFDSDYCTWCAQWEEQIGVIYDLTLESCNASLRKIDIGDDIPDSILLKKEIQYTPTFVLVFKNHEVARITGYPGEEFFWSMLQEAIDEQIPKEVRRLNLENCENT